MTDDMAPVFRALADPGRRVLLDRLFERDGQTLGELCEHLPGMTRFGVMKHLGVLEEAELVTTQRVGREKRHFLNPVPIRLVHDRWTGKFAEPIAGSLTTIKTQLETPMDRIDHVYSIYIKAAPERVWRAITDGDDTLRYYYGTRVASDWQRRLAADLRLPRRLASPPTARSSRSTRGARSRCRSIRAGTPRSMPRDRSAWSGSSSRPTTAARGSPSRAR